MRPGSTYLTGWGASHASGRLTNQDLVGRLDTNLAWLDAKVGITERRVAADGETVTTLGADALLDAVKSAGITLDTVDLIVGATSFDDHDMPAVAARIADRVGSQAFTFDVRAACSGWLVGLEVADAYLATGRAETVAVVATEQTTLGVDPTDRASVIFFGDGAGAAIVAKDAPRRGARLVDSVRRSDNAEHAAVRLHRGGWFQMDAPVTRRWVERAMIDASSDLLARNGLASGDVRGLVCHQANLRLIERFASALGVDPARHWHNVEWAGNTWSAGAPTSLTEALDREGADLADGDPILVVTVGAGLNVMATLLRWTVA